MNVWAFTRGGSANYLGVRSHIFGTDERGILMRLTAIAAFTIIAIAGLGVQVEAQPPCQEYFRLRNAATEAWKQAMRAPSSERCGALYQASLAAEATLNYATGHREFMRHFCPIAKPGGTVPSRGGTGSPQCLCWTPASAISSRYHPTSQKWIGPGLPCALSNDPRKPQLDLEARRIVQQIDFHAM